MTEEEAIERAAAINDGLGEEATTMAKVVPLLQYSVVVIKAADSAKYEALDNEQKLDYYQGWIAAVSITGIPDVPEIVIP